MLVLIILVVIVMGILVMGWMAYNSLVSMRQLVRNAWADVDVFLKRRAELIPNLVTAVKAYATHEQTVLSAVTEARSRAASLVKPGHEKSVAEGEVGSALFNVIAIAEAYPELKASSNFVQLQQELSDTERSIASARQYYNACVRDYNIKRESFPTGIVAGMMNLEPAEFFELDSVTERSVPSVRDM